MKKKAIVIGAACAVVLWAVIGIIDFVAVSSYRKPIFCVAWKTSDDGGSGKYVGLGYSFDIMGNFMPEDDPREVTSYKGRLFGFEVCSGLLEDTSLPAETENTTESVVKAPPALTVICGTETVNALGGTYSWSYQNDDGTWIGVESDCIHPLDSKEYMTPLQIHYTPDSSVDPLRAYLKWDILPDKVTVNCWSGEYWGVYDAESESVFAETDPQNPDRYTIKLKDGEYIYDVVAQWRGKETWNGTAHFSFYTVGH